MRPQLGKQKLLDAAAKLFEAQGYYSTTVEQISEEAGVSKGLVYNYFSSKEELLAGLIESATNRMTFVTETRVPNGSIQDPLSLFLDNYLSFLKTEKRFLKLQLTLMLMPELKHVVMKSQRTRATLMLNLLIDWFRQAGVKLSKNKARLFLAMLDGVALHYLCIYERYPLDTMKSQLLQAAKHICSDAN